MGAFKKLLRTLKGKKIWKDMNQEERNALTESQQFHYKQNQVKHNMERHKPSNVKYNSFTEVELNQLEPAVYNKLARNKLLSLGQNMVSINAKMDPSNPNFQSLSGTNMNKMYASKQNINMKMRMIQGKLRTAKNSSPAAGGRRRRNTMRRSKK
jgi:hypothetical protein